MSFHRIHSLWLLAITLPLQTQSAPILDLPVLENQIVKTFIINYRNEHQLHPLTESYELKKLALTSAVPNASRENFGHTDQENNDYDYRANQIDYDGMNAEIAASINIPCGTNLASEAKTKWISEELLKILLNSPDHKKILNDDVTIELSGSKTYKIKNWNDYGFAVAVSDCIVPGNTAYRYRKVSLSIAYGTTQDLPTDITWSMAR